MTHIVAGYPDWSASVQLVEAMIQNGADLIEIQIPFTDPLADGPVIAWAGQAALDGGMTPIRSLALLAELSRRFPRFPFLIMTYGNIAFRMGIPAFLARVRNAGGVGVIIPDLPFDECPEFREAARELGICAIPVVSPGMEAKRLESVLQGVKGFVYATLRVGITGERSGLTDDGLRFIREVRACSASPVAAGFGISSPESARRVGKWADCAIVGSHVISLYHRGGVPAVAEFVSRCKAADG